MKCLRHYSIKCYIDWSSLQDTAEGKVRQFKELKCSKWGRMWAKDVTDVTSKSMLSRWFTGIEVSHTDEVNRCYRFGLRERKRIPITWIVIVGGIRCPQSVDFTGMQEQSMQHVSDNCSVALTHWLMAKRCVCPAGVLEISLSHHHRQGSRSRRRVAWRHKHFVA